MFIRYLRPVLQSLSKRHRSFSQLRHRTLAKFMAELVGGKIEIGDDSVIAAGAVVTKSIPPGVLAGGIPAKVIRSLF